MTVKVFFAADLAPMVARFVEFSSGFFKLVPLSADGTPSKYGAQDFPAETITDVVPWPAR